MSAFDGLQKASFDGIVFPVSRISVRGGLRDHVHEYPHAPGGAPEKLGRKLYVIEVSSPMHETLLTYPHAYSARLPSLQLAFEDQVTADLTLPNLGTIPAYAIEWERDFDARKRSGEDCKFVFREDASGVFLMNQLIAQSAATLFTSAGALALEAQAFPNQSIFGAIQSVANATSGIADQVELYGNLLEAKVLGLASLCEQADHTLAILNQPINHTLLDALHDVWISAVKLHEDVLKQSKPVIDFVVPALMPITGVATALYGDSSRAVEILRMNAINDAFAIPPGTVIKAYAA